MPSEVIETFQDRIILDNVKDLSFVDVGGLWGTVNEKVTVASRGGAKSLAMADIQREGNQYWQAFHEHAAERGVTDYKSFPGVDIDDLETPNRIGTFDFVHCSGILYHVPNLIFTIERLRSVTNKYLLLGSMVVPEVVENEKGRISFEGGRVVFMPAMDAETIAIMAAHFDQSGIKIWNVNAEEAPLRKPNGKPDYGPWWWLYSGTTQTKMLENCGFRVLDHSLFWDGRVAYTFCVKSSF